MSTDKYNMERSTVAPPPPRDQNCSQSPQKWGGGCWETQDVGGSRKSKKRSHQVKNQHQNCVTLAAAGVPRPPHRGSAGGGVIRDDARSPAGQKQKNIMKEHTLLNT